MERVTVTLDARTIAQIRQVAGRRGVSAFLRTAARDRLARLTPLQLIDELDRKYGPPSEAMRAEVESKARRIFR